MIPAIIFQATLPTSKSFAEYLKFIESLEPKIDKLCNYKLNTAIKIIQAAQNSQNQRNNLLR